MDADESKAWWVLGPTVHCVPREDEGFCLLDSTKERGEKWGAVGARGRQAPYLLTVIVPRASRAGRCCLSRTNIPKTRPGGWAAGLVLPGWGGSEKALGQERGSRLNVPCCLRRMGRPGCMAFMRFLGKWWPVSYLLPAGHGPAPRIPGEQVALQAPLYPAASKSSWACL